MAAQQHEYAETVTSTRELHQALAFFPAKRRNVDNTLASIHSTADFSTDFVHLLFEYVLCSQGQAVIS